MTVREKLPASETLSAVRSRLSAGDHFAVNAQECASRREFRKAAELLWGGVTQYLKALAAVAGQEIRNHGQFFEFTREYAAVSGLPEFYSEFVALNALHSHFYDAIIPDDVFPDYNGRAIRYMQTIHGLLERWNPSIAEAPQT